MEDHGWIQPLFGGIPYRVRPEDVVYDHTERERPNRQHMLEDQEDVPPQDMAVEEVVVEAEVEPTGEDRADNVPLGATDTRVVRIDQPIEETIPEFVSSSESQDSSYLDVLQWIQEQFPDTVENKPPAKSSGSLVESLFGQTKTISSLPALPWSKGCVDAALDTDSVMSGSATARRSAVGPLRMGKSIPPPDFNYKYYRIQSVDNLQPVTVNRSFEDLVPSRDRETLKKTKPEVSLEELKSLEVSSRKTRALSSALDWQIASAVKILQSICDTTPTPGLSKALSFYYQQGRQHLRSRRSPRLPWVASC